MSSFGRLATLQAYVHGERIWLHETSKRDAEKGGNNSEQCLLVGTMILSHIIARIYCYIRAGNTYVTVAIDC